MPPNYPNRTKKAQDKGRELEPAAMPIPDNLPDIGTRELVFVEGLLEGKTASAAYRLAFDVEGWKAISVHTEASRLKRDSLIQLWLRHFQRMGADQARLTLESHLAELARLRELAVDAGQISAGVQAETARGKASGLYEDVLRVKVGESDESLLRALSGFLGQDATGQLARQLGAPMIDVTPDGDVTGSDG